MARGAIEITHLSFADDSYLFFKEDAQESHHVKKCLEQYEKVFGPMINFEKSTITFSSNFLDQDKAEISDLLVVPPKVPCGKYPGLPSIVGRNKKATFGYIKEKICNRLND